MLPVTGYNKNVTGYNKNVTRSVAEPKLFIFGSGSTFFLILAPAPAPALF